MFLAAFALAGCSVSFGHCSTSPADWYVDVNAVSCASGNGTASAPFCTIAEAIAAALDDDTIYISEGTYYENLYVLEDLRFIGRSGRDLTFVDGGFNSSVFLIYSGATVTIDGLTIQHGDMDAGGGISSSGFLTLRNSTVSENYASGWSTPWPFPTVHPGFGGGLSLGGAGTTDLINTIISNNVARNAGGALGLGGGIYAGSTELSVTECAIAGNRGGGIYAEGSILRLTGSTVSNQLSGVSGGGVTVAGGSAMEILNTTIAFNIGLGLDTRGAAPGSTIRVEGTTLSNNGAGWWTSNFLAPEIRNTIIAGNPIDVSGVFTSLGHNFVGNPGNSFGFGGNGDQVGTVAAPLDPLLGLLAANGGPTATLAPLAGSPLINTGDPSAFAPRDQRGYVRVGAADIGAHEFGASGGDLIANCASAPNSTGAFGVMSAAGSFSVSDNSLTLAASSLPQNSLAIFITSRTAGFVAQPGGSAGNLCLGGAVGRFVGHGQIRATGSAGAIALAIDLDLHPTPSGLIPVNAGETWYYQAWHRDVGPIGATSNFSAGTQVSFVP